MIGLRKILDYGSFIFIVMILLYSTVPIIAASENEWPLFAHDEKNNCYSLGEAPDTSDILWATDGLGGWQTGPITVNGYLYFSNPDGSIYQLNAYTGELGWEYHTGSHVVQTPSLASGNGMIYAGSYVDQRVYALDQTDGNLEWTYDTIGAIGGPPTFSNGVVYICCQAGYLYALDYLTGSEIRVVNLGGFLMTPAIASDTLVIGSWSGPVQALDLDTGDVLWSYPAGIVRSPAIHENIVIFKATNEHVYALSLEDGSLIWEQDGTWGEGGTPAIAYGKVFFVWGGTASAWALDLATGEIVWGVNYGLGVPTNAHVCAIADDKLFCGGGTSIYALDVEDGSTIWSYDTGSSMSSAPIVAYGNLYMGSGNTMFAFGETVTEIEGTGEFKPNILNAKSHGRWITAFIELPEGYDVNMIDTSSLGLWHEDTQITGPRAHSVKIGDHDGDGIIDLKMKFSRRDLITYIIVNEIVQEISLTIKGTIEGTPFKATINLTIK